MDAKQWVNETLKDKISNGFIVLDEIQAVEIDTFIIFFGGAIESEEEDKYKALSGEHTFMWNEEEVTRTAKELGYAPFFDEWNKDGLI
jgi:protoporphyrinogen oxidase